MDTALNINGDLDLMIGRGARVVGATTEIETAEKENASGAANSEALLVALATHQPTIEYTTELLDCQGISIPTLDEIDTLLAQAARTRIESTYREVEDTRARIEREEAARQMALTAVQERAAQTKTALAGLADERAAMERKATAFLAGEQLKDMLGKIHLAFNAKQLELEAALTLTEGELNEVETEAQAATLTDALELQLIQQELDRLASAAPEVAEQVELQATASEKIAAALQAAQEGLVHDAAVLIEQAKAGHADLQQIAEVEQVLAEARQAKTARDLIARINANPDQPGATRRIHKLMEEAAAAGLAEKVASFANGALETARDAANARYAQARPIADHLASEGYVPVVGDGRIEAWKATPRNGHSTVWMLDHLMRLGAQGTWVTEKPRISVTQKELPLRVRHSRWFRAAGENPAA